MALAMNRAFSATLLGSRESLGRCPKLAVNAAPLALKAHRKPEGLVLRTNQTGRFRITSFLQLRESDLFGRGRIAQLSFFFLRRSFFARGAAEGRRSIDRRYRAHHTNEVERANILAPGFRRLTNRRTPSSRLHRTGMFSGDDWPM